jgi:hypothetical protein
MRLLMGDSVLINILLYFPPCDVPLFGVAKPLIDAVDTKPLLIPNEFSRTLRLATTSPYKYTRKGMLLAISEFDQLA